ncbi:hypothetical protein Hamer_G009691, partial [Homarus americanus]
ARRTCSWCGYLSPTFETVGKHWYKCKKKMPHPSEAHDGGHDIYRLLRESNFFLGMEFHRGNLYIPKRPRRLPFKGPDIRKIGLYCSTKQELFKATKENAIKASCGTNMDCEDEQLAELEVWVWPEWWGERHLSGQQVFPSLSQDNGVLQKGIGDIKCGHPVRQPRVHTGGLSGALWEIFVNGESRVCYYNSRWI